jgi:hypothetical protein
LLGNSKIMAGLGLAALLAAGCSEDDERPLDCTRSDPPNAPTGVYSITADTEIWIFWTANQESDIAGYDVYYNTDGTNRFEYLATVDADPEPYYVDTGLSNGETRYYAVLAFNEAGLESPLSFEDVFDTPRPEGRVTLEARETFPGSAGFDFEDLLSAPVAFDDAEADFYLSRAGSDPPRLVVRSGVDVQDFGYFGPDSGIDGIDWAPEFGWLAADSVECVEGHGYVFRLVAADMAVHYAKVYVVTVTLGSQPRVLLDWAYQVAPGNQELSIEPPVEAAR